MKPALLHILRAVLVAAVGAIAQAIVSSFDKYHGGHDHHQQDWEDD